MGRLLSPLCRGGDSAACGTRANVLQRDAGGMRIGPYSVGLSPAYPAAVPPPCQPQTAPREGKGRHPRNGPGEWLLGDAGVPPTLSLLSLTSTYLPSRGWPRPARSPSAPPSAFGVGWDVSPAGPPVPVPQEPVHSGRLAGACDSSTSFTRASSSLSKHVKPTNKSLGGRHIEWSRHNSY